MTDNVVDRFLTAVESASMGATDLFAEDAVLDATVPNWRFTVRGGEEVRGQLSGWYNQPGTFEDLRRTLLPGGELVEFVRAWMEDGVPHACHQAHKLGLANGRIVALTTWCGGRWPASLLAEMEASGAVG
jgi:hypothetical protein